MSVGFSPSSKCPFGKPQKLLSTIPSFLLFLTKISNGKLTLNLKECIYFFEQLSKNEELLYNKKYNINDNDIASKTLNEFKNDYYKDMYFSNYIV